MRHGEAERPRADDAGRELVPQGVQDVARVAQEFSSRYPPPALIAVSPFDRTRQTVEIVQMHVAAGRQETWNELVPTTSVQPVIERLDSPELDGIEDVMLVTHQPLISLLTDWLSGEAPLIRPSTLLVINTEILKPEWGNLECVITA